MTILTDDNQVKAEIDWARAFSLRVVAPPLLANASAVLPAPSAPGALQDPPAGPTGYPAPELTPRKLEVLTLVAEGRTNGQIGRDLFISTRTVSVHFSNVLAKLGAGTRTEAVALARRLGLLPR